MLDQAVAWILTTVRDTLNAVWKLVASTLFHLPDVTSLPQVQDLASRSLVVVNAVYVLAFVAAGIAVMTQDNVPIRYGASELLPRLVIGLVAANFATRLCVAIISSANALVLALTGQGVASTGSVGRLVSLISDQLLNPVAGLLAAVLGVILVVLVVLLMVGWVTRFVWLILLCGLAPLALACHATPWTEAVASLWWRAMAGICAVVVLQALVLNTSLSVLLAPGAGLARYGMPDDRSGLLSLLLALVLLWITVRIPALVHRYLSQSGSRPNIMGTLVRLVIAQQVTRGLGTGVRAALAGLTRRPAASVALGRVGAHRDGNRHAHARPPADPLGPFLVQGQARVGASRGDSGRHATRRLGDDPLLDALYAPVARRRTSGGSSARPASPGRYSPDASGRTSPPRPTPPAGATSGPPAMRTDPPRTPPRRTPPPNRRNP